MGDVLRIVGKAVEVLRPRPVALIPHRQLVERAAPRAPGALRARHSIDGVISAATALARALLPLLAAVALSSSCTGVGKRVGGKSTEGALTELQEQIAAVPPEQQGIIAERNAKAAVRGMLNELSSPERQSQLSNIIQQAISDALRSAAHPVPSSEQTGGSGAGGGEGAGPPIQDISAQIARGVAKALSRELLAEFGPQGEGPLSTSLASSTERITSSAVTGIRQEMTAFAGGCIGQDPEKCLDQRVRELGKSAAAGMLDAVRVPVLILAFVLGFVACLMLVQLVGLARWSRRRRTEKPDTRARSPVRV